MIIATASISGKAMTRMPMNIDQNHAHSKLRPQCWKSAVTAAPPRHGEVAARSADGGGLKPCTPPPPPYSAWSPSPFRGGFWKAPSLRRLLELDALHQLLGAALHRRAVAADGVGEEEVGDRVADRDLGLRGKLRRRPRQVDEPVAAELGIVRNHRR